MVSLDNGIDLEEEYKALVVHIFSDKNTSLSECIELMKHLQIPTVKDVVIYPKGNNND